MNLQEPLLRTGKIGPSKRFEVHKLSAMGPPKERAPKSKSVALSSSKSKTPDLPWGRSHASLVLNSSSNRRSASSKSTDNEEERIIVALTEGRGEARCEVGIAVVNVSRPILVLCQTSDSQSYSNTLTKLNIFNPHLIVYPATFETGKENRLIAEIRKRFPNKKLVTLPRKSFNKGLGLDSLYKICIAKSFPLVMMIKNRYYALAAAAGLLSYLQDNLYIYYASNSIKLDYQTSEGYAIIGIIPFFMLIIPLCKVQSFLDIATADRLELVSSNQPAQANKYSSLFGIMNRCLTRVGSRNLRSLILQPLYSKDKIDERLNCVEQLIKNPEILMSVQGVLPKLASIDQLLAISTLVPEDPQRCSNRQLNYLLLLNGVLDTLEPIKEALRSATQPFFVELRDLLGQEDFEVLKKLIRETIYESAYSAKGQQAEQQRIWAIKPGLNGLLDLVRKSYSERIEDMRDYVRKLGQKYDLPLTLANNNKKGFHITMVLNQNQKRHMKSSDLPPEFIQVFRLANSFTMKTAELVNLNTRIDDILTDLFFLSNLMIHDLTVKIKRFAALFYELVESIAYLDVLQSMAETSYANGWTRPKFDEYTEIIGSLHPLLSFLCQKTPVSNTITTCEHYNFHIVTGPNGAGKSIFIRQAMLLQIMAQTGCFVPAQTAIFRPADKMFARVSNDDDMESNASSFVLEMTEVNYILNTMTDKSLIIIDELCRSTSLEEGTAIAMSICDALARSKAFTFVTTHYTLLTKLADLFFNIKVWQLQTIPSGDPNHPKTMKLDFKFSLIPGATTLREYGIYMVRGIWPEEVMRHVDELRLTFKNKSQDLKFPCLDQRARHRYDLDCQIDKLKRKNKLTLANFNKLANAYNSEMEKLGGSDLQIISENVIEALRETMDQASAGLIHSIFDASTSNEYHNQEKINLNSDSSAPSTTFLNEPNPVDEEQIGISSAASQIHILDDGGSIISSAGNRMRKVFTPESGLDETQSSSIYCSTDLIENLEPEIHLSYSSSQCSLNLTEKALNEKVNRISYDAKESGKDTHFIDKSVSQLSSNALSQKLEIARKETDDFEVEAKDFEFLHPAHLSKAPQNRPAASESPFARNFAKHLQDDARKTSTPLNCTSVYQQTNSSSFSDVTEKEIDKIALTIPRNVLEVDMSLMEKDMQSFAEELVSDDLEQCDIVSDNKKNEENRLLDIDKLKPTHIYPNVIIIPGPCDISSETDYNASLDDDMIPVGPVLKMPQLENPIKPKPVTLNEEAMVSHGIAESNDDIEIGEQVGNCKATKKPINNSFMELDDSEKNIGNKFAKKNQSNSNGQYKEIEENIVEREASNLTKNISTDVNEIASSPDIFSNNANMDSIEFTEIHKKSAKTDYPQIPLPNENIEQNSWASKDSFSYSPLVPRTCEATIVVEQTVNYIKEAINTSTTETDICVIEDDKPAKTAKNKSSELADIDDDERALNVNDSRQVSEIEKLQDAIGNESVSEKNPGDPYETKLKASIEKIQSYSIEEYKSALERKCKHKRNLRSQFSNVGTESRTNKIVEAAENTEKRSVKRKRNISASSTSEKTDFSKTSKVAKTNKTSSTDNTHTKTKFKETISISEASKLRNLEGDFSSSSSSIKKKCHVLANYEESEINLSEVSNTRNLESNGASSLVTQQGLEQVSESLAQSEIKKPKQMRKKIKKFKAPLKKDSSNSSSSRENKSCLQSYRSIDDFRSLHLPAEKCINDSDKGTSFIYPSKLSKKAIEQEFYEQDRKFFEFSSSGSCTDLTKLWEERLKRPSRPTPKQIQQTTCLATIRKTSEGSVEVIPTKENETRRSGTLKSLLSFQNTSSSALDMNMFSDQNAKFFDQFIKSNYKDYTKFNLNFGSRDQEEDGNMFDFRQINAVTSEYTQNSQSWTFVRKRSEEQNMQNQFAGNFPSINMQSENILFSTRDFSKNPSDIANIIKKYQ